MTAHRFRPTRHDAARIRQHEPRPPLGAALVVFLPDAVRDLVPDAAGLHADHVAQEQRGDFGGHQSVVGAASDARQLHRTADVVDLPDVLPQFRAGVGLRGDDHDADQRAGGVRALAHAVLGLGHARDRHLSHLPHSGDAALHPAVQDVRRVQRVDRHPAHEPLVGAADRLPDADGAVLHLDHDRLFRLDPEGARRGGADGRRQLPADSDRACSSRWRCPA